MELSSDMDQQFDDPGNTVDHIISIHNKGTSNDIYDLSFTGAWPVVFRDIGDTMDITDIAVNSGTSEDFIARVSIPGGSSEGDYDIAEITAVSQGDPLLNDTFDILSGVPFSNPWLDDFESGVFGGTFGINWTSTNNSIVGVNTATSKSGSYSMYISGGSVNVTSYGLNTSDLSEVEFRGWIRRGDMGFSEPPDVDEDLNVFYRNDLGNWILLDTLSGGGTPGEIFNTKFTLPADAKHKEFQIRFEMTEGDGMNNDFWHMDNIYVGPPITHQFYITPDESYGIGLPDDSVDHIFTMDNSGSVNDTFDLVVSDNNWVVTFRDIGDTSDISNISVLAGTQKSFIVRVTVPGGQPSDLIDFANITITSQADPLLFETVMTRTIIRIPLPWFENFELGSLGGRSGINWSESGPGYAGVSNDTSSSGIYSMYTNGDTVSVTSWFMDSSSFSCLEILCWIRRGQDTFSENPENTEDLVIHYLNDTGVWILIETFSGGGRSGEIINFRFQFPEDALHDELRVSFSQLDGDGAGFDYWHIDDVMIRKPLPYEVQIKPPKSVRFGSAEDEIDHLMTIHNWGENTDTFALGSSGSWPLVIRDALDTQDISQVIIAGGDNIDIIVKVSIPSDATFGDSDISWIWAASQNDIAVNDTSGVETIVPVIPLWSDNMEGGSGNWITWDDGNGTLWELGNPASWPFGPPGSNSPSNCWGTNIAGNYTNSAEATLALQYMDLGSYSNAILSFYHWYDINGNSNDGGWVEVTTDFGNSWNTLYPTGNYPDQTAMDQDSFAGSTGAWVYVEFDLSSYYREFIQIRFHFKDFPSDSQERAGWYIDDIILSLGSGGFRSEATGPVGGPSTNGFITIDYTNSSWIDAVELYYTTDLKEPYTWTFLGSDDNPSGFFFWVIPTDGSYGWFAKSTVELAPTPSDPPEASYYIYDVLSPEITSGQPVPDETNVFINQFIIIEFSEPMDNDTLTISCIPDPGGWSVDWNKNNEKATLLHTNFDFSQTYTFEVTNAQDMVGKNLVPGSFPNPWNFTTEATDSRPPTVFRTLPTGSEALRDDVIIITFNETMNTASVESAFSFTDGTSTWSIANGGVNWNSPANNRMSFNPTADFDYSLTYTVTLDSDLARDVNGNYLDGNQNGIAEGGPSDDYVWSFTIQDKPDVTPPVSEIGDFDQYQNSPTFNIPWNGTDETGIEYVELYYTLDGGTTWSRFGDHHYSSPIQFSASFEGEYGFYLVATDNSTNFNREAAPVSGTVPEKTTILDIVDPTVDAGENVYTNVEITLFPMVSDSGSGIENITWMVQSAPSTGTVTWSDRFILNTTVAADKPGTYVLRLIVKDNAGNIAFDDVNLIWDSTGPTATGSPQGDSISIFSDVTITFSEPVNTLSAEASFSISPSVTGEFLWNAQGNQMTFVLDDWFFSNTRYTVTVDSSGVFDLAGNQMEGDLTWSFTTSSSRTNNIMGQIVDMNGYPITGVSISLEGTNFITETDENGEYILSDVPVGNYTLLMEKGGYDKESREVLVDPYQPTIVPQIAMEKKAEEFNPIWIILAIIIIALVLVIFITLIRKSQKGAAPPEDGSQPPQDQYPPPPTMGDQIYPYGAPQSQIPPPYYPPGYAPPPSQPPQEAPPSDEDTTKGPAKEDSDDVVSEGPAKEEPSSETSAPETPSGEGTPLEEKPTQGSQGAIPIASQETGETKPDIKACINCTQPMPPGTSICPFCQWDQNKPLPPPPPQYSGY
jgi:uncharacterized membrane protein